MPIIRVEMWEGRDDETKKKLVKNLTDATTKTIGCPDDAVTIVLYDVPKKHWAKAGKVASDK